MEVNTRGLKKKFKGWEKANPSAGGQGGKKIQWSGRHVVEVQSIKMKDSERFNNTFWIAEYKVLESDSKKTEVGETYSWVHDVDNKWYGAAGVKQFMGACMGFHKDSEGAMEVELDDVEEALGEEQPLKGVRLHLITTPKTTDNGNEITVHEWWPDEMWPEDVVSEEDEDEDEDEDDED